MTGPDLEALSRVDLNLLRSFDALVSERSVTLAAARLSVGQPAMSASLGRLRRLFDDPLLVREGSRLVPTPVAEALREPIARALQVVSSTVNARRRFDPLTSERTFRLMADDHVILVLLKPLLRVLPTEAPHVRINVLPVADDLLGAVRRGEADLAVAPRPGDASLPEIVSSELLTDRWVCAVAADHPSIGSTLTLTALRSHPHLVDEERSSGELHRRLRDHGIGDEADVHTQSAVVSALMLPGTDMVTVLPSRLAEVFASRGLIRALEPPLALPELTESMHWSSRDHDEPGQRWLRERLARAAAELGASSDGSSDGSSGGSSGGSSDRSSGGSSDRA